MESDPSRLEGSSSRLDVVGFIRPRAPSAADQTPVMIELAPSLRKSAMPAPTDDNPPVKRSKTDVAPLKRREPKDDIPLMEDVVPYLTKSTITTPIEDNPPVKRSKTDVAPP